LVAIGLVILLDLFGLPNVAAAIMLAGLYVVVLSLLRSGAFSSSWLERHTSASARRAMRLELAKALICAGVGVDGLPLLFDTRHHADAGLSDVLILTWALLVVVGIGVFVVRAFAAYLVSIRR
jgi:hypothetical protein